MSGDDLFDELRPEPNDKPKRKPRRVGVALAPAAYPAPVTDPYLLPPRSVISFSGGRTSGMMLWQILQAHGGTLPPEVHVTFANTGREMPETLDFVQECSERWGVRIVWLEYSADAEHKTAIVDHNSASRNGEPFDAVIASRMMLPNPVMRFCTIEMKIRRIQKYVRYHLGWDRWHSVVGLRADEPTRVRSQHARTASGKDGKDRGLPLMPLFEAGVTKRDVQTFWSQQPFDLRLLNVNGTTPEGNCDLCFLKGATAIQATMRRRPETAAWWIGKEATAIRQGKTRDERMCLFRADRPAYAALFEASQRQGDLLEPQEESVDCACTD